MNNIVHPFGKEYRQYETTFADKKLIVEVNKVAFQATGAALVRYGDTVLLATTTVSEQPNEFAGFFPLMVEYQERWYASGKIAGSRFVKREGRPSDRAVLISRLIDRPIRPLFPKGYRNSVQIVITALSIDPSIPTEVLGIIAASVSTILAGVPFDGPVAAAKFGIMDRKLAINPGIEEDQESRLELVVAGKQDSIMMVEAGANEVQEETIIKAFEQAIEAWQPVIELQKQIVQDLGIETKPYELFKPSQEVEQKIVEFLGDDWSQKLNLSSNNNRKEVISSLRDQVIEALAVSEYTPELAREISSDDIADRYPKGEVLEAFEGLVHKQVRQGILIDQERPDGRKSTDIRTLSMEVGFLPRTHGSAIFTRGATQTISVATLGSVGSAQLIDTMEEDTDKRYMHHYNFPPFSVGDARPMRSAGRREIGHGALAERAIEPMIPDKGQFPYTIRVVSDITSSSGSTSMASVCGSTLSLMDAGVPLKRPVSGIAMGLVIDKDNPGNYQILSDIQDAEDFAGDMDFKVAGTSTGITALQMDIKVKGLTLEILGKALDQAKQGRLEILGKMLEVIDQPRTSLSPFAPAIITIQIDPDKIGAVIGKGGETIQGIIADTGVEIDIQDDGQILITSPDQVASDRAIAIIQGLVAEPEIGKVYQVKVVKVLDFGAFVEYLPGKEGMIHISEIADKRIEDLTQEVEVGDQFEAKLIGVDDRGRVKLSKRAANQ